MTDLDRKVLAEQRVWRTYQMLVDAAEAGELCPSNVDIAKRLGVTSTNSAARCMAVLAKGKMIEVESFANARRVTIRASGKKTAPITENPRWKRELTGRVEINDNEIEHLRVDRDPCGFCGVRADVGCRHSRRAA